MRRLCVRSIAVVGMLAASAAPSIARTVDLALVLAVDVSGSVNAERFELQRQGYAKAFASHELVDAIAAGENHAIAVTFVEWSGATHQKQMIGWTFISDANSALSFSSAVSEAPRVFGDWTSISGALDYAASLFDNVGGVTAIRRVIDVSGDGVNNHGRSVNDARDDAVNAGLTVNGLPILSEYPTLDAYYRDNVIGGPGAFVVAVSDFDGFGDAIIGKLVREIAEARFVRLGYR